MEYKVHLGSWCSETQAICRRVSTDSSMTSNLKVSHRTFSVQIDGIISFVVLFGRSIQVYIVLVDLRTIFLRKRMSGSGKQWSRSWQLGQVESGESIFLPSPRETEEISSMADAIEALNTWSKYA